MLDDRHPYRADAALLPASYLLSRIGVTAGAVPSRKPSCTPYSTRSRFSASVSPTETNLPSSDVVKYWSDRAIRLSFLFAQLCLSRSIMAASLFASPYSTHCTEWLYVSSTLSPHSLPALMILTS